MHLSGIDLNLLVSLEVLLEECNVTRSAQRLNISQPALSAQLSRLRLVFNDPLLLPAEKGRGMTPTAMGLGLKAPLALALMGLKEVVRFQPSFDPRKDIRHFKLAASDSAMAVFGGPLFDSLRCYAPHQLRFSFSRVHKGAIAAQAEQGDIDLLIDDARLIPDNMKTRTLLPCGFVMAQRQGHPRGQGPLDLEGYCALEHLLVSSDTLNPRGYADEYLSTLGRQRNVVATLPQLSLVPGMLCHSDLVCTLPTSLLMKGAEGLELYELPFSVPEFALKMAWHPRNHYEPGVMWLRDVIQDIAVSF